MIGITSAGDVRGCLAMPEAFDEGNVRRRALAEIWGDPSGFAYNRCRTERHLEGACLRCAFRRVCRGGCKVLAYAAAGTTTHNPYCARLLDGADEIGRPT